MPASPPSTTPLSLSSTTVSSSVSPTQDFLGFHRQAVGAGLFLGQIRRHVHQHRHPRWRTGEHSYFQHEHPCPPRFHLRSSGIQDCFRYVPIIHIHIHILRIPNTNMHFPQACSPTSTKSTAAPPGAQALSPPATARASPLSSSSTLQLPRARRFTRLLPRRTRD
jgi:hypothetical protein